MIGDPPAAGSAVDMTANSEAFAWRPRLKFKAEWVRPQTNARTHPPGAGLSTLREPSRDAMSWTPPVGPAWLSTAERREMAHAAEGDRLLRGGTREVRKSRERIMAACRGRLWP